MVLLSKVQEQTIEEDSLPEQYIEENDNSSCAIEQEDTINNCCLKDN